MILAVVSAMESELSAFRALFGAQKKETVSGLDVYEADYEKTHLVMTACGEGKACAAFCTEMMILRYAPDALVFSGVAGGIADDLKAGDLVIGRSFVQHDFDLVPLGFGPCVIPLVNKAEIASDETLSSLLLKAARTACPDVLSREGLMATGDQFVCSAAQTEKILSLCPADSVDMETAAFALVCAVNGKPFTALRAISDKGDGKAFCNFREFLEFAVRHTSSTLDAFVRLINETL